CSSVTTPASSCTATRIKRSSRSANGGGASIREPRGRGGSTCCRASAFSRSSRGASPWSWSSSKSKGLEVRDRVQEILARIVDDPVERPAPFDAKHLVDAAQREVMGAPVLVAARILQPGADADALNERGGLIGSGHRESGKC